LTWMKDNTPDPLGDPDAYYKLFPLGYQYPSMAYGVTTWWDYGYWVSRIAHRLPSANPSQDPNAIKRVANLFLATDEAGTEKALAELESSYIIADFELITAKLWAVIDWAGQAQDKYFSVYYINSQGTIRQVRLMTPDFYRSLLVRLYCFDGEAVAGGKPFVVTYTDQVSKGVHYKVVTNAQQYDSYQAAQSYIAAQPSGNYDIVSTNPFVSPVPLEAVPDFKLVYSSQYSITYSENATVPQIKIFEHVK
jgi:asparagine N-glycosylation enzyme membrane subunit Stt3